MAVTYVTSSAVSAVAYDAASGILRVRFQDGRTYQYSGVPVDVHRALLGAESKGTFFNRTIRGQFSYVREPICARAPVA